MTIKNARNFVCILTFAGLIFLSCVSNPTTPQPSPADGNSLATLVASGQSAEVKKRFTNAESVNQKDAQGQTLLHVAALQNNADMVQILLDLKADTRIKNNSGETAMAAAVNAGCYDAVKTLALAGSDIFATNAAGMSVYNQARQRGPDAFSAILSPATIVLQDPDGKTALHHACASLDEDAVSAILAVGSPSSRTDSTGETPLAASYKNPVSDASARIASLILLAAGEPLRGDFSYFETAVLKRNLSMRFEEGKTPLHIAAANGHTGYVNFFLSRKAAVNVKDVSSSTPLHEAVRAGHVESAGVLLAAGADPNQKDSSGNTALHLVMPEASRSKIFTLLLGARADPNQKDSYGDTPLHIAARLGMSEDIIQALVSAGADIDERNKKGVTPLALAIERKQLVQAALFVKMGADIHAEDIDGETALVKAMKVGSDMVKAIITSENIQSRDSQGRTALHITVMTRSDPAVINFLISRKADINARDKNGDTPLHIAVRNNDRANGEILLAYGADVFTPNVSGESALKAALTRMGGRQDWVLNSTVIKSSDGSGNTPLHLAAEWQLANVVSFIVQKGGDLNTKNANGETPLFNAVKSDSSATARIMLSGELDRKTDINARDFLGNTALHACVRWSASGAAETLLQFDRQSNGKKLVNARNLAGKTALHEAARSGNTSFISMLLSSNADINAIDETGKTALTDAIAANQIPAVKILLGKGASPAMQDMYGRNAFHEAVEASTVEVISLLRSAGGNPMARDSWGKTPLSLSFHKNSATVLSVIGSDANLADSDGNTPLHIAVSEHASEEILTTLLKANYPVNNRNRTGSTALLLAVQKGNEMGARVLLASGADPFATDNAGESAVSITLTNMPRLLDVLGEYAADKTDTIGDGLLHYAARMADGESVRKLLTMPRIDRGAVNVAGETPYAVAVRWQRPDIATLLK